MFNLAYTVAVCFEIERICCYMELSHEIYRISWCLVPSHEILKLNEAEPSMAGAVVPEHKSHSQMLGKFEYGLPAKF